jgi:PAS domain S-box-containing protein
MLEKKSDFRQKLFEKVIIQSPISILITDIDGNIEYTNPAFSQISGYPSDEVLGKNPKILNSGEHDKDFFADLWNTILKGETWKGEILNKKKDGTLYWEKEIISAIFNENNEVTNFICTKEDISELVKAREELEKSEAQTRLLDDNLGDIIWVINHAWKFMYISSSIIEVTGYTSEEFENLKFEDFIVEDEIVKQINELNQQNTEIDLAEQITECRLRRKNGSIIWLESRIKPFYTSDGIKAGLIGVSRDITSRKRTEIALINSEARFKSFFKQSNAVILVVDPEKQKITGANNAATDYYGYSLEEFQQLDLNLEFSGFIHAIQVEASVTASESKNIYAQKHRLKNGQLREVEIYPARVMTLDKLLIYIIVYDITQRKRAIEALKESESKKLALLKIIPDLIFVINKKGEFVDIYSDNPERLNIEPHKLLGKKIHHFFPVEMCKQLEEKIETAIETREVQTFEFRYKRDSEKYVFEEVRIIASADGEVLLIIRDISKQKNYETELKRAWEEAEEANKVKSVFLANISHEIRTPLNAILGFSDLLNVELRNTSNQHYVEAIKDSSKTLLNLINDLLDLSRIEAGKMSISYSETNLPLLFSEIEKIHSLKLNDKKLDFKCVIDDSVPTLIHFDELRLRQILLNLIGNAIKFTDFGKIDVSVLAYKVTNDKSDDLIDLIISIKDTGIGIEKKNQVEIFEAFKQQDSQDARKYGGTGLGLAISKRLVEMLNGNIELQSTPGKGSVFTVTFFGVQALSDIIKQQTHKIDNKFGRIIFKPELVLIADDVPTNRFFLKGIFKGSQMTFYEADNGEEAIEIIKKYKPAIALLDLRMPFVDGLDVAMFIKTNEEYRHIITFGISATVVSYESDTRIRYLDEFISKPVDIGTILKRLSKYISVIDKVKVIEQKVDNLIEEQEIDKSIFQRFVRIAREDIKPILDKISHTSSFTDYEIFSKILIAKGADLKINKLTFIGNAISEAVKSFDLDAIAKNINEYLNFEKSMLESSNG